MMKFFPPNTLAQLEFDKIKDLVQSHCKHDYAKNRNADLRIHTKKSFIDTDLNQTHEFKLLLDSGLYFPNDFLTNISKEIKLLGIPGAMLTGDQCLLVKKLSNNIQQIFRWFDAERRTAYPNLAMVINGCYHEKMIQQLIDEIIDEYGAVKDNASEDLANIRLSLYKKRNELRRVFDKIVGKLNKLGYLSDIEESFMNGRRVLAVFAEQKRMIKGILHAESDSRKTSFIEPEETTGLNNDIFSLENEETKEVYRILRKLTQQLSAYADLLHQYYIITGEFDFIRAKAKFAQDINGQLPLVHDTALVKLYRAYHPLLYLYNQKQQKQTIPVDLSLDANNRILVISGPNAGGKTVTLKTVGLLQIMMQSGLLVPVSADSEMGIFKQMMIHIGDTQSIEFELSTYSAHLTHMKQFMEMANGKTLFFIDELGSGSDPNLGGAFAEVIMEELAKKHAMGIVTTHYLNLKVMANKVTGIFNGAMLFDEKNLLPLYKLKVGAPGSSYTFSIAERIGLDKKLIERARKLVDENHFQLDKLLNATEQDLQHITKEKQQLQILLKENERMKKEMHEIIRKEKHQQEMERIKLNNKIAEEKISYLKDMERKLKSLVVEWRKAEDKDAVVKMIQHLLMGQKEKFQTEKHLKKWNEKFEEIGGEIVVGQKVKMKQNRQVGIVKEIRGKKAILQVGVVPISVMLTDLIPVKEIAQKENASE
jgi:DNA mismatch repair protein MutS2